MKGINKEDKITLPLNLDGVDSIVKEEMPDIIFNRNGTKLTLVKRDNKYEWVLV